MKKKIFLLGTLFTLFSAIINAQSGSNPELKSNKLDAKIIDLDNGEYHSLSLDDVLKKYEGKVIYLDFWASWCGPCRHEMPYSQKLKKELSGKDVAFVYISTDQNATKWKNMIDQLQITGDHYRASIPVRDEIVKEFNLQYIPRYILIDKMGKVINQNARRPSDPLVKKDIEALL
jgi:thiol-disulfide isomerase/thioredoxin